MDPLVEIIQVSKTFVNGEFETRVPEEINLAKVYSTDQKVSENTPVQAVLTVEKSAVFDRDGNKTIWIIQNGG